MALEFARLLAKNRPCYAPKFKNSVLFCIILRMKFIILFRDYFFTIDNVYAF